METDISEIAATYQLPAFSNLRRKTEIIQKNELRRPRDIATSQNEAIGCYTSDMSFQLSKFD